MCRAYNKTRNNKAIRAKLLLLLKCEKNLNAFSKRGKKPQTQKKIKNLSSLICKLEIKIKSKIQVLVIS